MLRHRSRLDLVAGIAQCKGALRSPPDVIGVMLLISVVLAGKQVWQGLSRQQELTACKVSSSANLCEPTSMLDHSDAAGACSASYEFDV